jgi:hypothetical protein
MAKAWSAQKVFLCAKCGKRWPRQEWFQVCDGTYLHRHPACFMKRIRQTPARNPIEMAAHALRFDR